MYALVTITNWYYCEKKSVEIRLFNTLKEAKEHVLTDKEPVITEFLDKRTWTYPSYSNGQETFKTYITEDIEPPTDNEVQINMFDELE